MASYWPTQLPAATHFSIHSYAALRPTSHPLESKLRETRALSQPARKARLPTGVQTFSTLRRGNYYYADKTHFAVQLKEEGSHYFLSRPRRFGKSLFVSTLKELFEGNRELFRGLAAYDQWDWSVRRPVVLLDFSQVHATVRGGLDAFVGDRLLRLEIEHRTERRFVTPAARLEDLIRTLHERSGRRTVLLVDEYDKPILDALREPDLATENRDYLRSLYSVVKGCDASLRFSFLTGVTKFSKVSLFSGANSLIDLTLEAQFSSICGYTERDLDEVFAPELEGLDRERIRAWYNGYSWGGEERVYNPFDLLLLFRKREFQPWWFETGTPDHLIQLLARRGVRVGTLEGVQASESELGKFDIEGTSDKALLFQSGYLTLAGSSKRRGKTFHRLEHPNREVRQCFYEALADALVGSESRREEDSDELDRCLRETDFEGLRRRIRSVLASIPHQWYDTSPLANYEAHYAAALLVFFKGLPDVRLTTEDSSSMGRLDMALQAYGQVYLLEFKVLDRSKPGAAIEQMKRRRYMDKYRGLGQPIHLVGLYFSRETRNVERFEVETV